MISKHKFQKKSGNFITRLHIISILYCSFISLVFLTSQTGAYFNSSNNVNFDIHAEVLELEELEEQKGESDESSTILLGNKDYEEACEETNLSVVIVDNGQDMKEPANYEECTNDKEENNSENQTTIEIDKKQNNMQEINKNSKDEEGENINSEHEEEKNIDLESNDPEKITKAEGE